MFRKLLLSLLLLPALAQADVGLFWPCESTTVTSGGGYSAGDTSASATGGGAIDTTGVLAGTNGCRTVDGNDFWDLDSATIFSGTVAVQGFLFRFPSAWPSSGDVFGPQLRNSSAGTNTYAFRGDSTNRFEGRVGQAGGTTLDYNLTGGLSTATTYFGVWRVDIANDKRKIEVYSYSAGACSLIESREDTSTDLAGASPTSINQIRIGATTYTGVIYIDNVFVSTEYDEPVQDYCGITAFAPTHTSGPTVGTKTNTTIPISWTADQKGTEYAVACPNGQTANQSQIVAGNCSGGAAVASFSESSSAATGDSASLTGLSSGTTYDVYTTFVTDIGGTLASVVSIPDQTTTSGGSPPSFSVAPSVSATGGNSITLSYTPSASATFYGLGCPIAESTPSAAQTLAGNCQSGAAGVSVSEAVTGADTTAVTPLLLPKVDLHSALTNVGGDSSVSSLTDQLRSARSGYALVTIASISSTGICDEDAYFDPDCAVGDVIEYEIATNENAGCAVSISTAGEVTFTPTDDDDCDGRLTFEYSIMDVSATSGLFTAPAGLANFSTDDTAIANNTGPSIDVSDVLTVVLTEDEVMEDRFLLDVCADPDDGDELMVSVSAGTLPAGTALDSASGLWNGTPSTEDESGEVLTLRCTDQSGAYAEDDITVYVVNTWTVPNCVGSDAGECADLVAAAAPWRDADPGVAIGGYACGSPTGDISAQDPAASAEAAALDILSVTVKRSCGRSKLGLGLQ